MKNPSPIQQLLNAFMSGSDPLALIRDTHRNPIPEHGHDFNELVFIMAGTGIHHTPHEQYPVAAGDVFLIRPGLSHGYRNTRGLHVVNILYYPERLVWHDLDLKDLPGYRAFFEMEPVLRRQHGFKSRLRLSAAQLDRARHHSHALEEELRSSSPGRIQMSLARFMLIKGFIARAYSAQDTPHTREVLRISELLRFMESNYHRHDLTLDTLAARAAMSRTTLNRFFNRTLEISPVNFLIRIRLRNAARLLRESDERISDIAFNTGFSDSNFFSRQFRQTYGRTPRDFRKNTDSPPSTPFRE